MIKIERPVPSVITAILVINIVVLYALNSIVPDAPSFLGLVTANTLLWNKYIWNLLTSAFYEESMLKLFVNIWFFVLVSPSAIDYLPIDQFALYVFATILGSSLTTSFYCIIRFFSTGREAMILEPIYGCSGVIIALTMYCRKHLGKTPILTVTKIDQNIENAAVDTLIKVSSQVTFNNLPLIIIFVELLCWFLRFRWLALDTPFAISSLVISWSYLKFYYRNGKQVNCTFVLLYFFCYCFIFGLHCL